MNAPPALGDDPRLAAVLRRQALPGLPFVFAVATTGIYCRPDCPARRPKPQNIRFFATGAAARADGFRACKRCKPDQDRPVDPAMVPVGKVIAAIDAHLAAGGEGLPGLDDLAAQAKLSPWHLQRTFTRFVGVSPRVYAEAQRLHRFKAALRTGQGVADATYAAGFGSSSRSYAAAVGLGMTPATYAKGGAGARLRWATAPCSLGLVLIAATGRGLAALYLGDDEAALVRELAREFPAAQLLPDDGSLRTWLQAIVAYLDADTPCPDLPLDVRATAFQCRVWEALRRIPPGETRSYAELAVALGVPKGQRAVGRACATNPVSLVIPCHRAVRTDGSLSGYRWGLERKDRLLKKEGAR
jgi:AraC family transcriptional regulator of adaptative response/methylated-DNA-[protein]-cysteine methyltransferase